MEQNVKSYSSRAIFSLAWPSIAANITTPVLGMVDTAITGHMGSARYVAAIAVGSVMFNMLYWIFSFLRSGTSGMSAQATGAGDMRQSTLILYRSLSVAFLVGFLMIALQSPLTDILVSFVKPDAETAILARRYFRILIWGAPATLATYSLTGWFLGRQNSRVNLWTSLIINLTNIAVSIFLVYALRWKIEGVATGTLVAQWAGLLAGMLFLFPVSLARVRIPRIFRWNELKGFFSVNIYIMLRTVFIVLTTVWFTRKGAEQGSVILAVNTILMQLFLFFSYFMDGFAFAGESLVGLSTGAGDRAGERQCIHSLFRWGWGLALVFTAIYFLFGEWFLSIMTSDPAVPPVAHEFWWWAVTIPLAGVGAFIWDGVFIGKTMTREMLISIVVATAFFFVLIYILIPIIGNHGLWLAFTAYAMLRGVVQWAIYRHIAGRIVC